MTPPDLFIFFTKVTDSRPWAGIEPAPSHQAGLAGGEDSPAPGFLIFKANPGAGIIPALVVAEGPILAPKSYAQAWVGLVGPGQTIFSCPVNPDQAHCGVPVHQSPKCVLDCSQGPAGRDCHSLGSRWAFIHSQKEDPLRNLLVYGLGDQGNNMDLPILGVLQQYLGLLVICLGLLHLSLGQLILRLGCLLLKLGLWHLKLGLQHRA
ncbi:hypothetical protein DSO57_1027603 [Entomophthora muscae]|uniref:Uncharacterized protein n=1 Tax=Entomophthora muscae TaxID=34485 RepID=A0ACC2RGS7_9FUNG|nr:hypothetical protein DSO57_1027603 [Entomophthora muscae]